jgi:hypothetical protein
MRVWVDLTNSPHPLVLRPVIEQLRRGGHDVDVTARDFAQTVELCERLGLGATVIGRHRGGRVADKAAGLASRSWELTRWARRRGFDVAIGHGSNDVSIAAAVLRIPSATMFDYEWASVQHNINCRSRARSSCRMRSRPAPAPLRRRRQASPLPGPQGGVLPADFEPNDAVLDELAPRPRGADRRRAHAARRLALPPLRQRPAAGGPRPRARAQTVVLPRTADQRRELLADGGFIVPEHAIDAQSLIAYADLVISAGGTMNREAVALGTPVWTTFEGRLGAVDEQLIAKAGSQARIRPTRSSSSSAAPPPGAHPPRPGAV